MARTLQTTGIAAKLMFLCGIEDDNSTVKVFKSQNSSLSDNTADVNTDITRDAQVTVATMTWNGHTVPYIANGVSYPWITFGTNKPYVASTGGGKGTYFFVGRTPSVAGQRAIFSGSTSIVPSMGRTSAAEHWYAVLFRTDVTWISWSNADFCNLSTDETWAFVHNSTGTSTQRFFTAVAGSALAEQRNGTNDAWNASGDLTNVGGIDEFSTFGNGRIILVGAFNDEIAVADLAPVHADPYGSTLFVTGGAPAAVTPQLMTLGVG